MAESKFHFTGARVPVKFNFNDFYLGGKLPPSLPKVELIARREARRFSIEADYALNSEDLIAHALMLAIQVYDQVAHSKCPDLDSLYKYYTVCVRREFYTLIRDRLRSLHTEEINEDDEKKRRKPAMEFSLDAMLADSDDPDARGKAELLRRLGVNPQSRFEVSFKEILHRLEVDPLATELFNLFLERNEDFELQVDFSFCLLASAEDGKRVDIQRLTRVLSKHGWSAGERGLTTQGVWNSLELMRKTVFECVDHHTIGDMSWENHSLSRKHPRESPSSPAKNHQKEK